MTTKVARGRSLTKKAVPKKSVVSSRKKTPAKKNTASKSSPIKKTIKTKNKKSKKPVAQKQTAAQTLLKKRPLKTSKKRRGSKKTVDKKRQKRAVSQTTFQEKLDIKTVKGAKTLSSTKERRVSKRRSFLPLAGKMPVSLALLSLTKLPVSVDAFAVQTARMGGLMIVAMGAFFTLLYSQYIWNSSVIADNISGDQMLGQLSGCESFTGDTLLYEQCTTTIPNHEVTETEPPVTFDVPASEPLSGVVPIKIQVQNANRVEVLVFKESYNTPVSLGYATQTGSDVWRFDWDTTQLPDVKYKVVADVWNNYNFNEPYRDSDDSGYLQVSNTIVETESTPDSVSTSTVDTQPSVHIHLTSIDTLTGIAHFNVQVSQAQEITLFAHHRDSGSDNRLGDAIFDKDDVWGYQWDTNTYTAGEYVVTARVKNEYGSYMDGKDELTVAHATEGDATESSVASNTLSDTQVNPIITIPTETDTETLTEPPQAVLKMQEDGALSDHVEILVHIDTAEFVELWLIPEGSKIEKIVALANHTSSTSDDWVYQWNTHDTPNGDYTLFARVKNAFGVYKSNFKKVHVFNKPFEPALTAAQEEESEKITTAQAIEHELTTVDTNPEVSKEESSASEEKVAIEEGLQVGADEANHEVDTLITDFSEEIDNALHRLTTAYRTNDPAVIQRAQSRLEALKQEMANSLVDTQSTQDLRQRLDSRIDTIVSDHKVLAAKAEDLITQRVGDSVFKDSDSDGVSDYDERTLYKTDPYSADSDGDGFNDGAEIFEGYDPLDVKREVAVVFESPKEKGIVREDILAVKSIVPVVPEDPEDDTDGVEAQAVISGVGLPNSFVTLYIYSTPTIVTVKTQADGSWQYRFDRELEDGEHNIYVGVTDNAGRIVAKSAAFTFVKEAQAFSPVEHSVSGTLTTDQSQDSLLSTYMIYLILSVSVVSIGLVLILLGLHLDARQRRFAELVNQEKTS